MMVDTMETCPIRAGSTESDTFDLPKILASPFELDIFRYRLYSASGAALAHIPIVWAWFQFNAVTNIAEIMKSLRQGSLLVTFRHKISDTKSSKR